MNLILRRTVAALADHATAVAFGCLAYATLAFAAATGEAGPNILLIVADDYGIDVSPLYTDGDPTVVAPTPHIASLAEQGVTFENVWAQPACSPTRATIITGKYAERTGIGWVTGRSTPPGELDVADADLLPKVLAARGYRSALIGKWHLTTGPAAPSDPQTAGYDYFAGFTAGALGGLGPGGYFDWPQVIQGTEARTDRFATTENVDQAIEFIEDQSGSWFVSLNFAAPHWPYDLPPEELVDPAVVADVTSQLGSYTPGLTAGADSSVRQRRAAFNALVSAMDTEIGRLLEHVDLSNTCVIFVGDNGTQGGVAGFLSNFNVLSESEDPARAKNTLYEGGVRVPMVMAGAGTPRSGIRSRLLVNTTDLYSTILQLAGDRFWKRFDSISVLPSLRTGIHFRRYAITEQYLPENPINAGAFGGTVQVGYAIRTSRYKLIVPSDLDGPLPWELYDLVRDPGEDSNLFGTPFGRFVGGYLNLLSTYIFAKG